MHAISNLAKGAIPSRGLMRVGANVLMALLCFPFLALSAVAVETEYTSDSALAGDLQRVLDVRRSGDDASYYGAVERVAWTHLLTRMIVDGDAWGGGGMDSRFSGEFHLYGLYMRPDVLWDAALLECVESFHSSDLLAYQYLVSKEVAGTQFSRPLSGEQEIMLVRFLVRFLEQYEQPAVLSTSLFSNGVFSLQERDPRDSVALRLLESSHEEGYDAVARFFPRASAESQAAIGTWYESDSRPGPAALKLAEELFAGDATLRSGAGRALARLAAMSPDFLPLLGELCCDVNESVSLSTAKAIAANRSVDPHVPALEHALSASYSVQTREIALLALTRATNASVSLRLAAPFLSSSEPSLRGAACLLAFVSGREDLRPSAIKYLGGAGESPWVYANLPASLFDEKETAASLAAAIDAAEPGTQAAIAANVIATLTRPAEPADAPVSARRVVELIESYGWARTIRKLDGYASGPGARRAMLGISAWAAFLDLVAKRSGREELYSLCSEVFDAAGKAPVFYDVAAAMLAYHLEHFEPQGDGGNFLSRVLERFGREPAGARKRPHADAAGKTISAFRRVRCDPLLAAPLVKVLLRRLDTFAGDFSCFYNGPFEILAAIGGDEVFARFEHVLTNEESLQGPVVWALADRAKSGLAVPRKLFELSLHRTGKTSGNDLSSILSMLSGQSYATDEIGAVLAVLKELIATGGKRPVYALLSLDLKMRECRQFLYDLTAQNDLSDVNSLIAAGALAEINDRRGIEFLTAALTRGVPDAVRYAPVCALAEFIRPENMPYFVQAVQRPGTATLMERAQLLSKVVAACQIRLRELGMPLYDRRPSY